jgi:hypothetical protein
MTGILKVYILKLFFPLIGWRRFAQGFHDLDILLLTMLTADPVLPWLQVAVFHHLVTVRTAGGERIDSYLPVLRHEDLIENPFYNIP